MDTIVGLTIIWVGIIIPLVYIATARRLNPSSRSATLRKERLRNHATAIIVVSTLFVTYGIFRNQAKLAANASLNDEVMQLYSIEMETDEVRCIYHNYGHDDPARCLSRLTSSGSNWSKAMFYVEETWYALERGEREFGEWGSDYSRSLEFWADDLERDPTGIFAYYMVANSEAPAEAISGMRTSGVYPDEADPGAWRHLCDRYISVWRNLGANRPLEYPHGADGAAVVCLREHRLLQ
jgi:hypothetical protein